MVIVADIQYTSASEQPNIPLVVIYEKAAFLTLKMFAENLPWEILQRLSVTEQFGG